jgi:hypothetical protein
MIKHLCKNILYKTGMINTEATAKLESFFKNIVWAPSISRLPPSVRGAFPFVIVPNIKKSKVARGAGSIKADQWRSQITVFFVGLFDAWLVSRSQTPQVL